MNIEPCPYCGGPAEVGGLFPWVECNECDASGPVAGYTCEAVQAWNRVAATVSAFKDAEVVDIRNDGQNGGESALLGAATRAGYYRDGTRLRIVPEVES